MNRPSRRRFFWTLAGGCAGIAGGSATARAQQNPSRRLPREQQSLQAVRKSSHAFGSSIAITALHSNCELAGKAIADALSTAVFVMSIEQGRALITSLPNTDALFVLKSGRTLATRGFPLESI